MRPLPPQLLPLCSLRQQQPLSPYSHILPTLCQLQLRARAQPPTSLYPHSSFSTSSALWKGDRRPRDRRLTLLRYHLTHPRIPRPLRLSRHRSLRHWTIHRAWQLLRGKQRRAHDLELERMHNSMRDACEALRLLPGDDGRLYRKAMVKKGIYGPAGWPIEASRIQTEWPSTTGWQDKWTR